ncbi:NmrA family NAD(P)-binding protein [Piscinibacterium candidicorallinum]|uniref:NmrA family NAD(P)-binding protein n=1 Tax=Piscinibacterium candidicorallinum TaxID=1793872 RepID=A0ABV7H503_9BURK
MSNRILVTGASGTIGSTLVKLLSEAGANFEVLRSKGAATPGTRVASYEDVAALTEAFRGVDTLFLLFPLVENKLQLAKNAAAAAKAAGVKHIVRSSGAGADPASPFALPRLQGEIDAVITATGIPSTFIRPAGFMQNFASFMAGQVQSGTVYAAQGANGGEAQSLIDARDIAAVAATILLDPAPHAGRAYTLTGGESLTTQQALDVIGAAAGHPVKYQPVRFEDAVAAMNGMGMPAWMVNLFDSLNRIVAAGYAAGISPDVETLLGRKPISVAQFARDHAAAWKKAA